MKKVTAKTDKRTAKTPEEVPVFSVGKKGRLFFWAVWRGEEDIYKWGTFHPLKEPLAHGQCSSIEDGIERARAVQPSAVRIHNRHAAYQSWLKQDDSRRDEVKRLFADARDLFLRCEEDGWTFEDEEHALESHEQDRALKLARQVGSFASLQMWGIAVGALSLDDIESDDEEGSAEAFDEEMVALPEDHYAMGGA